ncbi:MAG: GDP-mannose 4,6-dehydratase [Chthoniobacterales bacterium]
MRTALVIGANGQDGRLLTGSLLERDYAVRGWTRTPPAAPAPCECAAVDLLDAGRVEREIKRLSPDEIYYLAAYHHSTEDRVEVSATELLRRSFEVHVVGLLNVLHSAKVSCPEARLFYAASSHVFGTPVGELQDEQTPLRPTSAYGISKAAGIRCCQLARRDGIFAACGILFNHESALRRPSFLSQKIVRGALRARRDPNYRLALGDLDARVDWGYAPDYVDAMFRILQLPEPSDFVVASGELHSVREFAEAAFGAVDLDWQRHVVADARLLNRKSHPFRGDFTSLRLATGWKPSLSFSQLVATLVRDTQNAYESC